METHGPPPAADATTSPEAAREGLEDELGWSLHRVMTGYALRAVDAVADLPGAARGYQVLVAVEEGPTTSQLALARRLGLDKTAVTYLVDDLERAGLVTRQPDPRDRRVRNVLATPAGRVALQRARTDLRGIETRLLEVLGPEQAAQLRRSLVVVARSVAEQVRVHDEAASAVARRAPRP